MNMDDVVLKVSGLGVIFQVGSTEIHVIDRVSLDLCRGESTALLGETGCGKSVLASAIFGLLQASARISGTAAGFGHANLLSLTQLQINRLRGRKMVLIPQNPHGSLNPVYKIQWQLAESIRLNQKQNHAQMRDQVIELLEQVGFSHPQQIAGMFPHQLSGGMAQRVLIAVGLATNPNLVIADEPTKGMEAGDRDDVIRLMLNRFQHAAVLLITHDLMAAALCSRIAVMYAGEIVEIRPSGTLLQKPLHPYTQGLVHAHPVNALIPVQGSSPDLTDVPVGCRFHPRCDRADSRCQKKHPSLITTGASSIRCHHAAS